MTLPVVFRANPVVLAIVALALSLAPRPAAAAWPEFGRALCLAPGDQLHPRTATDGAAGAIVVWQDSRSTRVNVFARRVLASGEVDPAWPIDGRALLTDSTALAGAAGGQELPVIVPDGAGGAIVAWQDRRSAVSGLDIFAQHVLASGAVDPTWPANGRALCTAPGQQAMPAIVSDDAGGAIVAWSDGRSDVTDFDMYAQHVLASGVVDANWPANGRALTTAPAVQAFGRIATDGSGGAIVTWQDFRPSASGADIYAQHVTSSGSVDPLWPANGLGLCLAARNQSQPTIVSDGVHGAIVAWADPRDLVEHIYAQRVLGAGVIAAGWPVDGRAVCTAAIEQITPIITSDGASGAIVTWEDARNGQNHNPFIQHVLASGVVDPAWPVDGTALSLSSGEEIEEPSIVGDGAGGAIVSWEEDSFIFVNHVLASGLLDPTFPANGRFVKLDITFQRNPDLTAAGAGTAIVAWADAPSGPNHDIYAAIVVTEGTLGVDPGTLALGITFASPSPNPARGPLTLRFALPRPARVTLAIFDASGRRVRELASGVRSAGDHSLAWDLSDASGRAVDAGIYFARLEAEGHAFTRKLVALR